MTKRTGLTTAQHQQIGAELRQAHHSIVEASVAAANAYGKSTRRVQRIRRAALRAKNALAVMRSELEALHASHNEDWSTSDYYGPLERD